MDSDRVTGTAKQVKGSVKEAIGKLTGDVRAQAEGATEKATSEVQSVAGEAGDTARDAPPRR